MLENKIKLLLTEQNKRVKDLCTYIEVSDAGLRKMFARDSCETKTLLRIAEFFNVSPSFFLEDTTQQKTPTLDVFTSIHNNERSVSVNVNSDLVVALNTALEQNNRLLAIIEKMQR